MSSGMTAPSTESGRDTRRGRLTGTVTLMRFVLRRDRVRLSIWIVAVAGLTTAIAASFSETFPTAAARASRAELMSPPMMRAFNGPGFGLEDYTLGAMVANELLVLAMIAVALMSILLVIRHTRADEQAGRTELVRSSVTGSHATVVAVLGVAAGANLVTGAATASLLPAAGDLDAVGAWAFGMSVAAVGLVFAAVAAVAAQVIEHARGAIGIASAALGVAFVLRAIGDASGIDDRTLSWLSPLGWGQSTRVFVDERWWPLAPAVTLAVVLSSVALALSDRRDVAAGLVPPRPGRARGSARLAHPLGFAVRLHRGTLVGWSVGVGLLGAAFGAVIGDIEAFLADNPQLQEILGAVAGDGLLDSFLGTVVLLVALLATGAAVGAVLRLRSEEVDGRVEPVLATPLFRVRWAGGQVTVALGIGAVVVLAGTIGLGLVAALIQRDSALLGDVLVAGLVHVPAVWVAAGLAAALFGVAPRLASAGWLVLGYAALVGLLGEVLDLPDGARAVSPFHHVPTLPGGELNGGPVGLLLGVAAVAVVVGLAGFRRRDVAT